MSRNADELMRNLARGSGGPGARRPDWRSRLAFLRNGLGPAIGIGLVGLLLVVGVLVDHPGPSRSGPAPRAYASVNRFVIAPAALPSTADGHALTWGELFDLYGLEDETLRRSLEATFNRPFSLSEARDYRRTPVGQATVTVVLREES